GPPSNRINYEYYSSAPSSAEQGGLLAPERERRVGCNELAACQSATLGNLGGYAWRLRLPSGMIAAFHRKRGKAACEAMLPPSHESVPPHRGTDEDLQRQQDRGRHGGAGGMNLITGTAVAGHSLLAEAAGLQSELARGHAPVAEEARSGEQSWPF